MDMRFFPAELKALPQWCVASLLPGTDGKPDKAPYNPTNGRRASVTDRSTWGTFEQALAMRDHWRETSAPDAQVGFVFNEGDPFAVIDLDTYKAATERTKSFHSEVLANALTYTELSQSGLGTHIIGRGWVAEGAHNEPNAIEIYSHARFMICTGNVGANGQVRGVDDIQPLLDYLYPLLKGGKQGVVNWRDLGDGEESLISDVELVERASNAMNGDKFDRLCNGDLSDHGGDWSSADAALIQFLCWYTPDNNQVARLFMKSKLAERDKALRPDYVPRTISKMRGKLADETPPPIDATALVERAKALAAPEPAPPAPTRVDSASPAVAPIVARASEVTFPPGLVGEVAQYVLTSSSRPVPEIALAAAIAIVAGVAGRNYNVSASGLNLYILLLAKTGTGKESVQSSVDRLFSEMVKTIPAAERFVGPAHFASGPALVKVFQDKPCFVSILGEFGDRIMAMTHQRASESSKTLMSAMKDLFHKSGWGQSLRSSVYSDKEKNTSTVHAPCMTLLGETAPEPFFAGLNEQMIEGGFLPRFMVIEYKGERPPRNKQAITQPPADLVKRMCDLASSVLQMEQNQTHVSVSGTAEATAHLDAFDAYADDKMRGGTEVQQQLWNRAHIKALRLAALIAVGVNPYDPSITIEHAQWATEMVKRDVAVFVERFAKGDVGEGDSKLQADLVTVITKYMAAGNPKYAAYHSRGCVPSRYLMGSTNNRSAFKNHKLGANRAYKDTVQAMIDTGMLVRLDKKSAAEWFKTTSEVFALGDQWDGEAV